MRVLVVVVLGLIGCHSLVGPETVPPGPYELVAVNGMSLPFNEAELPISPVDPRPSECYARYTEGELEFGPPGRTFRFILVLRHSCLGHVLSSRIYTGSYERDRNRIRMWTPSDVVEIEYRAVMLEGNILLTKDQNVYYFRPRQAGGN